MVYPRDFVTYPYRTLPLRGEELTELFRVEPVHHALLCEYVARVKQQPPDGPGF